MHINGEYLKARRNRMGCTQEKFAEKVGVSRETVGGWERGTLGITPETAKKLAKVLGFGSVKELQQDIRDEQAQDGPLAQPGFVELKEKDRQQFRVWADRNAEEFRKMKGLSKGLVTMEALPRGLVAVQMYAYAGRLKEAIELSKELSWRTTGCAHYIFATLMAMGMEPYSIQKGDTDRLIYLTEYAVYARAAGMLDEARSAFDKALSIYDRSINKDPLTEARLCGNLFAVCLLQGRFEEALAFAKRGVKAASAFEEQDKSSSAREQTVRRTGDLVYARYWYGLPMATKTIAGVLAEKRLAGTHIYKYIQVKLAELRDWTECKGDVISETNNLLNLLNECSTFAEEKGWLFEQGMYLLAKSQCLLFRREEHLLAPNFGPIQDSLKQAKDFLLVRAQLEDWRDPLELAESNLDRLRGENGNKWLEHGTANGTTSKRPFLIQAQWLLESARWHLASGSNGMEAARQTIKDLNDLDKSVKIPPQSPLLKEAKRLQMCAGGQ